MGITYRLGHIDIVDVTQSYPDRFSAVPMAEKDLIVVHHTATPPNLNIAALAAAHEQFGGIGYQALIFDTGKIVMTGQWNTARAGAAQLATLNWRAYHLALVGDFTFEDPKTPALQSLSILIAELQYARGARLPIAPHRMFNVGEGLPRSKWDTACPGETWLRWWGRVVG